MYGNIVVPDMGKEKPEVGKVLAVGPGRITPEGNLVPNQIKVGQIVLVPKFGAQTMTVENETYIMASENDVLGILNKNEDNNE
jgi:chaperonin GroES